MPVPKRRMSRTNTRHRRARWAASRTDLVPIVIRGQTHLVPRRLQRAIERGYVEVDPR